jgi:hypothetical protein
MIGILVSDRSGNFIYKHFFIEQQCARVHHFQLVDIIEYGRLEKGLNPFFSLNSLTPNIRESERSDISSLK